MWIVQKHTITTKWVSLKIRERLAFYPEECRCVSVTVQFCVILEALLWRMCCFFVEDICHTASRGLQQAMIATHE